MRIITPIKKLVMFFMLLKPRLTQPQKSHALNFMERLISVKQLRHYQQ